jgi:hypothetical protein
MTTNELHGTPHWRHVLLAQVRIVGSALRWPALVSVVVLMVASGLIVAEIVSETRRRC